MPHIYGNIKAPMPASGRKAKCGRVKQQMHMHFIPWLPEVRKCAITCFVVVLLLRAPYSNFARQHVPTLFPSFNSEMSKYEVVRRATISATTTKSSKQLIANYIMLPLVLSGLGKSWSFSFHCFLHCHIEWDIAIWHRYSYKCTKG